MKRLFLAILLLIAPALALADLVARQGQDSVRLRMTPCARAGVLAQIDSLEPEAKASFRAAYAIFGGRSFEACWHPVEGGVHLIYEDGDQGLIPDGELHEDVGV